MFFLIYFFYFTLTYGHKCSLKTPLKSNDVYLCRQKLNISSIRVWLHLKINQSEQFQFSYYIFTLRTLDLMDDHVLHLEERFEKHIGQYSQLNRTQNENNTIDIHNLSPGRYEICVNLLYDKSQHFYYRSPNSCLHIPWDVPEEEFEEPDSLIKISFMISIIMLLVASAFVIHTVHQYVKSISKKSTVDDAEDNQEEQDEDQRNSERAKFLVRENFEPKVNPFELLVRRRIHQRYSQHSPDLDDR